MFPESVQEVIVRSKLSAYIAPPYCTNGSTAGAAQTKRITPTTIQHSQGAFVHSAASGTVKEKVVLQTTPHINLPPHHPDARKVSNRIDDAIRAKPRSEEGGARCAMKWTQIEARSELSSQRIITTSSPKKQLISMHPMPLLHPSLPHQSNHYHHSPSPFTFHPHPSPRRKIPTQPTSTCASCSKWQCQSKGGAPNHSHINLRSTDARKVSNRIDDATSAKPRSEEGGGEVCNEVNAD